MKGALLATVLCAFALAHAEINENGCPINPAIDILKPHPNCNKFYQCQNGELYARSCAANLVYNAETEQCDWPENVDCSNREEPAPGSNGSEESNNNGDNGGSGGNSNPGEAVQICAAEGSDGVLVAHENCNQFYKCSEGLPVALDCPLNLLYNPSNEQCDWPENVNCGDRNPDGGNGGNDGNGNENGGSDNGNGNGDNGGNGGNSNPGEAPQICAAEGSDGVLVAHENCNRFYKCSEGVPVALDCPLNLLYDPSKEQCDWPENVSCGNGNQDAGNGDNNGNGDGGNSGDSSDEGNSNPSEAIEICAAEGSDGVLVAHENCGQFYKCSEGLPVALDCPAGLLYNPSNEQCDWPENVNCDGRNPNSGLKKLIKRVNNNPSEAPRICATAGSNGVLVAHENCNQFYKCYGGIPVALDCPLNLLYNPNTEQCDWPENVNCADRTPDQGNGDNDNNGDGSNSGDSSDEGNGNPSEAIEICAAEGSDGVLVAHENCGQFYKCSEGLPVALDCPAGLLYNPSNEQCDWPSNVNCGDRNRNIFTSLNKHMNARRALRV